MKIPSKESILGAGVYKIRVEIQGKSSGEGYGARVIHAIFSIVSNVYLMRVYDKSDKKDLSPAELKEVKRLANAIRNEFKQNRKS